MIERIRLQNFQNHTDTRIRFAPGVTVLSGATGAGKSAILRALRWAVVNRPSGDAFIAHGAEAATVTVWADGQKVTRTTGKGGNKYLLDGKGFVSFKTGVPEEIGRLFNIDDLNWSLQHDSPFWFALTPGEVSRQLNAVVDLGVIDDVLGKLATARRKAEAEAGVSATRLAAADTAVENSAWVDDAAAEFADVAAAGAKHAQLAARQARLGALVARGVSLAQTRQRATGKAVAGRGVVAAGDAAKVAEDRAARLRSLIADTAKWQGKAKAPSDLAPVKRLLDVALAVRNKATRLRTLFEFYARAAAAGIAAEGKIKTAELKLAEFTKGKCPVCGGKLP